MSRLAFTVAFAVAVLLWTVCMVIGVTVVLPVFLAVTR
jgi:hypothetical protein